MKKLPLFEDNGNDVAYDAIDNTLGVLKNLFIAGKQAYNNSREYLEQSELIGHKPRLPLIFPDEYKTEIDRLKGAQLTSQFSAQFKHDKRFLALQEMYNFISRINTYRTHANNLEKEAYEKLRDTAYLKAFQRAKIKAKLYPHIGSELSRELHELEGLKRFAKYLPKIKFSSEISEIKERIRKYGYADVSGNMDKFNSAYPNSPVKNVNNTVVTIKKNNFINSEMLEDIKDYKGSLPPLSFLKSSSVDFSQNYAKFVDDFKSEEDSLTQGYDSDYLYMYTTKRPSGSIGRIPFLNVSNIKKIALQNALKKSLGDANLNLDIDELIKNEINSMNRDLIDINSFDFNKLFNQSHLKNFDTKNGFYVFAINDVGLKDAAMIAGQIPGAKVIRDQSVAENIVMKYLNP